MLAALTFIAGEFAGRFPWGYPLLYAGSVWLGIIAMAFTVFLVEWLAERVLPFQPRTVALTALALLLVLTAVSLFRGLQAPRIRQLRVPIKTLPAELSGFRIVQISDLHLGNLTSFKRLRRIVAEVNRLHANLVVITGDLIDRDICQQERFCQVLQQIRSEHGVLAVTGNHEFYAGRGVFADVAQRIGLRVLHNERVLVAGALQVAGLEDDQASQFGQPGPDLDRALLGRDPKKPLILLYHRPGRYLSAASKGVDLQLSGHTHAGQIPPMDLIVWLVYRHPYGFWRKGGYAIYTTCGTGTWGPPMRLFTRNEITSIVLESE